MWGLDKRKGISARACQNKRAPGDVKGTPHKGLQKDWQKSLYSNGTGILCPTEIGKIIQCNADPPHASGVVSLNGRKKVL